MIEGQAQLDRVGGTEGLLRQIRSIGVGGEGLLGGEVLLVRLSVFGDVAVVVGLHLVEKDFNLIGLRVGNEVVVKELEDSFTNTGKFTLNLPLILLNLHDVILVAYLQYKTCTSHLPLLFSFF